ncbi:hypothetical protein BLOT_000047 [Blomia tropicalis]|nr:hypothetical protein BLOT_000047 [Blomia tropicalis]
MAYNLWEPKNDEINETIDEVKRNERRTKHIEEVPSQLVSGETVGEKKLLGKTSQNAKFAFRFSDILLKKVL